MSASPAAAHSPAATEIGAAPRFSLAELGVHDWLVLGYCTVLMGAVLQGERGPDFTLNLGRVATLFGCAVFGIAVGRTGFFRDSWLTALVYRFAIYAPVQLSYFFFRDLLPSINPGTLDHELNAVDMSLFGIEPAMALDRFVTPHTTEWFAFFYFGYFFVLAVHVVPILFLSRSQRVLGEFGLGLLFIFCVGHTFYMLVPGYGPYRAMASEFKNAFPHGLWLDLVMDTVNSGGALKDIFPSLHTAAPTFITLFAFRNRSRAPYRYTWPIAALFSGNIMIATMFLRWHYLVDVVAGLALATSAILIVVPVVDWELERRSRKRRSLLWPGWTDSIG